MLNYNGDCKEIAEFLAQHNSYPICDSIEGHPTPGSLGHYAWEKYNSPVLTFECPVLADDLSLKDIWSKAVKTDSPQRHREDTERTQRGHRENITIRPQ